MITKEDIFITEYRGSKIYFSPETESFMCDLGEGRHDNSYAGGNKKLSYATVKKLIDTYLEDNSTFVPFRIIKTQFNGYARDQQSLRVGTIVGRRKDGRYNVVWEDNNESAVLGKYDVSDIYHYDEDNLKIGKEIDELEAQRRKYMNEFAIAHEALVKKLTLTRAIADTKDIY